MKDTKRYGRLIIIFFLLISIHVFGQQKCIYGTIYNHTKFAQFDCFGVIINDSLYENNYYKNIPFSYKIPKDQNIDSLKIQSSYGHHPIIFVNLPDCDSINLGSIPMFARYCLYYFIDDRNNIFSRISTINCNRKTKRFYRKKDNQIEKYRYVYNNHIYKIERQGDNLIINFDKYIK